MSVLKSIWNFLRERFHLEDDQKDEHLIIESIQKQVSFKGSSLWTLIFAILIASIGLNVNSTAVIIGAMLISPLMGPIMAIGLAIGILDFELLKKGIKNLAIAATISIVTSAIYFAITPLHETNSELLARTNPSLWDVFIAFFGGLAGIVASTRTETGNAVPGVAIATALMPPLCTAGYGLAMGQWWFFFGALYLFFINCLFICLATFLIVKQLRFHKKILTKEQKQRKVTRYIFIIVIITILPSIYLAYRVVQRSIFEGNAKSFVQKEFHFRNTQVVNRRFNMEGHKKSIELLLIGQELSPKIIDSLKNQMGKYDLSKATLIIRQGLNAKHEIDVAQIKASILEDIFKEEKSDSTNMQLNKLETPLPEIKTELKALFPAMIEYSLSHVILYGLDSTSTDTVTLFIAKTRKALPPSESKKIFSWLKERTKSDSLKMIIEQLK